MAHKKLHSVTKGRIVSDGIKTFWIDEGWPGNLPACRKPVTPIVPKYEYVTPEKPAVENGHESGPSEEPDHAER